MAVCYFGAGDEPADLAMTERLSPMDASFLAAEPAGYLLGARLLVFSGPAPGYEAVLRHFGDRVPLVPRLRHRVRRGFLELRPPRWEPDPDFEIVRHVRRMPLPQAEPGGELESLSEALLNEPLDVRRPLWELWYFEGLPGERFAIGVRVHHALADGDTALHLLSQLFPAAEAGSSHGVAPPLARQGARSGAAPIAGRGRPAPLRMAATLHPRRLPRRIRGARRRLALTAALAAPRRSAPETPLNSGPVGLERRVRLLSVPLDDLRLAKTALETTVNTLLVAAIAGGLRGYLLRRGWPLVNLVALIPVSLHEPGDPALGNRVTSVLCELPVAEADATARLRIVTESLSASVAAARAAGERRHLIGPQAWRDYVIRRRWRERPFNLIVTNTAGSTLPHLCCGREAQLVLGSGPNMQFAGPAIRVSRYLDDVTIAITTDRGQLPDTESLAAELRASLDELLAVARGSADGTERPPPRDGWVRTPWPRSTVPAP